MAKVLRYLLLLLSNRQRWCRFLWERLKEHHLQRCWVCDPAKIFLASKFSLYPFFATLHIKLKLGQQIGRGLLIANHSKTQSCSQIILLLSVLQVHSVAAPFTSILCAIMPSQNHFPKPNRHILPGSHTEHRWRCCNESI
jgi:hypothetical protein